MNDNNSTDIEKVRAFIRELARRIWEASNIDAGELQSLMVQHGILLSAVEIEPCSEECFCFHAYGEDAFPLTCYKLAAQWL